MCERDGTVVALRGKGYADAGAYMRPAANLGSASGTIHRPGLPHAQHPHAAINLATNKDPTGTYRAPGRFRADFIRERMFDSPPDDLGIDRVEFRRMNLASQAEMPTRCASLDSRPPRQRSSTTATITRSPWTRCLREFRWDEKRSGRASSSTAGTTA